jgi:hypothetical protein
VDSEVKVINVERLIDGQLSPPAPSEAVNDLVAATSERSLPSDYVDFLKRHNGGEGLVGKKYLILWKAEELMRFNREYEVEEYAPGIFLFGSSGGGEGYGFDFQDENCPVVRIPFVGMERRYARPVSKTFSDLFSRLASADHAG